MTEQEVKKRIGKKNWKAFCKWMYGQTLGVNEDGSIDYFECDVEAFEYKLKTGWDRQKSKFAWD